MISSVVSIQTDDPKKEIWYYLERFADPFFLQDTFKNQVGKVDRSTRSNLKRKALEIKRCINQAKEYYDSAKQVSLITRANLIYYGMVSLSLALILFKKEAAFSLGGLRAKGEKHHGLDLSEITKLDPNQDSVSLLQNIACKILPFGLFKVLYPCLSPIPTFGKTTYLYRTTSQTFKLLFSSGRLVPFSELIGKKFDCWTLLREIPDMYSFLDGHGLETFSTRGRILCEIDTVKKTASYEITIHHTRDTKQKDFFLSKIRFHPCTYGRISEIKLKDEISGFIASIKWSLESPASFEGFVTANTNIEDEILAYEKEPFCNYIVNQYIIMYCLSMLVRYYPDQWIRLVEQDHFVTRIIEYFIEASQRSFPNLILDELSGKIYAFHV